VPRHAAVMRNLCFSGLILSPSTKRKGIQRIYSNLDPYGSTQDEGWDVAGVGGEGNLHLLERRLHGGELDSINILTIFCKDCQIR
jgi:hypothetical protein